MLFNINIQHFPLPLRHKTQGVKKIAVSDASEKTGGFTFCFLGWNFKN